MKIYLLKNLWTLSLSEIFSSIKRRFFKKGSWDYSLEILNSKKHMNKQYLIDRWERYWRVIESNNQDSSKQYFKFKKKHILEIGCGPVLGWGPLAIFKGAEKYYYLEPSLMRSVVESQKLKEKYFIPLYKELVSNFGNLMDFENFYQKVLTNCIPIDFSNKNSIDLVLSNSVLEHIPREDMPNLMKEIYFVQKPGGYFLHAVDFSSHGFGGKGFGSIYSYSRSKGIKNLNLLRMSEIQNHFSEVGFENIHTTVYHSEIVDRSSLHKSWKSALNDDLTSRVVFFVGMKDLF
jgi:SAM-dependent methyltransferase